MFCENTPMARTPEDRKKIAREWNEVHKSPGGEGRKFLQYAFAPGAREELPPPRPPRGHYSPGRDTFGGGIKISQLVRTSIETQRNLAKFASDSIIVEDKRNIASRRMAEYLSLFVVDTNVVLHGLKVGPLPDCQQIVEIIEAQKIGLCVVPAIIHEMQRVAVSPEFMARNTMTPQAMNRLNRLLTETAIDVSVFPPDAEDIEPLACDPTDTPFLIAIEKSRAPVLVTRDGDLYNAPGALSGEFKIVSPYEFLDRIKRK